MPSPKWYRVKRQDNSWSKWYRSAALAARSETGQIFQWRDKKGEPSPYGDKPRRKRSSFPVTAKKGRGKVSHSWDDRQNLHESVYKDPEVSKNLLARRGIRSIDPVSARARSLARATESAIDSKGSNIHIHQNSTLPGTRVYVTDNIQVIHRKDLSGLRDANVSLFIRISPRTGNIKGYKIVPVRYGKTMKDDVISLGPSTSRKDIIEEVEKAYKRL